MSAKNPAFTPVEFTVPQVIGTSSDGRTNRWRVTCPNCGRQCEPPTTRLGWQGITCDNRKCLAYLRIDLTAYAERVTVEK